MTSFLDNFLNRQRFGIAGSEKVGIGGFALFARVSEVTNLTATVPISYVEDGSPLNDHIIQEPEKITIEGIVGDVYRAPDTNFLQITPLSDTLGSITAYIPQVTGFQRAVMSTINGAFNAARNKLNQLLNIGNQANNFLGNLDFSSKPLGEQFVDAMENIYYGKQIIAIDMPYRRLDSMVLTSISVKRDNSGEAMSFSIEAQRFRIAEIAYAAVEKSSPAKSPSAATGGQTKGVKDVGSQAGKPVKKTESFLKHYTPKGL